MDVTEAVARLRATEAAIRRVKENLRKQKQRLKKKQHDVSMTIQQKYVTCILVHVCNDDGTTAAHYIAQKKNKQKHKKTLEAWTHENLRLLAQIWRDECIGDAMKWRYPPNAIYARARQCAYDFIAERLLHEWLLETNMEKGVAPTSQQLLEHFLVLWPHAGVPGIANTPRFLLQQGAKFQRLWIYRWRKRWRVLYRRLRILPPLSAEEVEKRPLLVAKK